VLRKSEAEFGNPRRRGSIAGKSRSDYQAKCAALGWDKIHPNSIPKILLTGETGVGKTLIASYLGRSRGKDGEKPPRIALPEFADRESHFENEMFGFKGGSYTDAPSVGELGILLGNVGDAAQFLFFVRYGHEGGSLKSKSAFQKGQDGTAPAVG